MKKTAVQIFSLFIFIFFLSAGVNGSVYAQKKDVMNKKSKKESSKTMKKKQFFYAKLSGKNVVPPVKTDATGNAEFTFSKDGKSLHYVVYLKHIDMVTMAHIHHAPKGKNGPIAAWLYKGKPMSVVKGILSEGNLTNKDANLDSLRTWMMNGNAFVMVHTKDNPAGEIRGQIYYSGKSKMKK